MRPFFIKKLVLSVFCLVFLCYSSSVFAARKLQELKKEARNHYYGIGVDQSYAKALNLYLKAAARGDADSQYISGGMLYKGLGGPKNFPKAFMLLHEAAKNGRSSPESEQVLGQGFLVGSGVPKNFQKAEYWYSKAAKNNNAEAQNELGFMYFTGNGVEADQKKGAEMFLKAAKNGLPIAQYNVGIMYYTGNGIDTTDLVKAYGWLNLAAAGGHKEAGSARDFLETSLTPEELQKAQNLTDQLASQVRP